MRIKSYLILFLVIILAGCCISAVCEENSGAVVIPGEEWSWSRGAYNTFSGQISLEEFAGKELTVCLTTDLPYDTETESQSMPVFTSVNDRRIVMTKQSDTVQCIPESEDCSMRYSVSFRLPEKQHVDSISVTFHVKDKDRNELKTVSGRIYADENVSGKSGSPFYIHADTGLMTAVSAGAAAVVWILVLIKRILINKKQKTGE